MLEIFQAIVLGIVEGLTEFLPISSTGHLVVAQDVIGYKDTAHIFTVVIQMGAILAVLWFYRKDILEKLSGLARRQPDAVKFFVNIAIATIPVAVVGLILKDYFDEIANPTIVGLSLLVGGALIWLIETYHKPPKSPESGDKIDSISIKTATAVGLYQIVALIPGVSRSGATIMGGLLTGMDRVTATAFSFYLSIPIIFLAGGYELVSGRDNLQSISGGAPALVVGTVTAFFVALATMKWLLAYVSKRSFKIFAYYRVVVGLAVLLVIFLQ